MNREEIIAAIRRDLNARAEIAVECRDYDAAISYLSVALELCPRDLTRLAALRRVNYRRTIKAIEAMELETLS